MYGVYPASFDDPEYDEDRVPACIVIERPVCTLQVRNTPSKSSRSGIGQFFGQVASWEVACPNSLGTHFPMAMCTFTYFSVYIPKTYITLREYISMFALQLDLSSACPILSQAHATFHAGDSDMDGSWRRRPRAQRQLSL